MVHLSSVGATVYKPPGPPAYLPGRKSVFLAGSIDMGAAIDWQAALSTALAGYPVTILNPRRDDWDASWKQDITFTPFREQVEWELEAQERADVIAMYFDEKGMAPITLLELGLFARSGKMVVACPEGYWRRGNVQVVCQRYGIKMVDGLEELTSEVVKMLGFEEKI